jgi:hypothetical protein
LVDDWADHFAGATPFGPEVHEDGQIGVENFSLEICVSKVQSHARNLDTESRYVKSRPAICKAALGKFLD